MSAPAETGGSIVISFSMQASGPMSWASVAQPAAIVGSP